MQYTVIAHLKAKVGQADLLRELLLAQVGPTRAEPGNLNYDLHVSAADQAVFVLYENWRSDEDLTTHFQTPHMRDFSAKVNDLLAEAMDFQACRMVSVSAVPH